MITMQAGIAAPKPPDSTGPDTVTVISLDQNALPSMEPGGQIRSPWSEIRARLIAAVEAGNAVCPIPPETVIESLPLSPNRHRRLKDLQDRLSRGACLKPYPLVLAEEVLALVRPEVTAAPLKPGTWDDVETRWVRGPRDRLVNLKQQIQENMRSQSINYNNRGLSRDDIERVVHEGESGDLYRNLERMEAGHPLAPNRCYTASVCGFLKLHGITKDEIQKLKEQVLCHRYEVIPVLFYYARLLSQYEFDLLRGGRRQEVNDIHDLTRAALALWAADIYVCDAEMAETCRKVGMGELTGTIVMSVRHPKTLLEHLKASD
jgi:hypothetical protein